MSGSTPPPGGHDNGGEQPVESGPPGISHEASDDTVAFGGNTGQPPGEPPPGDAMAEPPRPRGTGVKVAAISAAMALVVGGGAFAFYKVDPLSLFRAGPQAAEAIPASAIVYVGIDLDPSAAQKIDALRFLNHFPAFRDNTDLADADADIRKEIFEQGLEAVECPDISYADTMEPWLGSKFGFGLMPKGDGVDEPDAVFAIEVTDQDAADEGLADLAECAETIGEKPFGYTASGDYVLLAETQELADGFADDAESSSLADSDDFGADMDSLGELGVATVWADIAGITDVFPEDLTDIGGSDAPSAAELDFLQDSFQRAAATFRFDNDHVEVVSSVRGDTAEIDHGDNEIVGLPDSTVFAMSESGGGARLDASWDDIMKVAESEGVDIEAELSAFEAETGFSLPDDLETLLGDNLLLAVDEEGLTAESIEAEDPTLFNAGIRLTGDADKLEDLSDRLISLVEDTSGQSLPFEKVDFDDGFAMASNDDYGQTLADLDGDLGDSDQFQSVTDDAAGKEFVLYFDWDLVEDQIIESMRNDGMGDDVIENLEPLRAFGITTEVEGDYTMTTFRLSVND